MRVTTDWGEIIRRLRDERGLSRSQLAERAGVSISHLEKIEAGHRSPGMNTFTRIMLELDVSIGLYSQDGTIHEKSVLTVQEIFLNCSEREVKYLTRMVECMAENLTLMI